MGAKGMLLLYRARSRVAVAVSWGEVAPRNDPSGASSALMDERKQSAHWIEGDRGIPSNKTGRSHERPVSISILRYLSRTR